MGPRYRPIFSIFGRYALVSVLEDFGIQAAFVGRGRAAHSDLRCGLLFLYAGRGSGGGEARHGDLGGLRNGAHRIGIRRARPGAELRFYPAR